MTDALAKEFAALARDIADHKRKLDAVGEGLDRTRALIEKHVGDLS